MDMFLIKRLNSLFRLIFVPRYYFYKCFCMNIYTFLHFNYCPTSLRLYTTSTEYLPTLKTLTSYTLPVDRILNHLTKKLLTLHISSIIIIYASLLGFGYTIHLP